MVKKDDIAKHYYNNTDSNKIPSLSFAILGCCIKKVNDFNKLTCLRDFKEHYLP